MKKKQWIKISLIFCIAFGMLIYASCKEEKEDTPQETSNSVNMKFNGAVWNTMITTGSQNSNSISVGSFTDAGTQAESFFLQFKKSSISQGGTFNESVLENYQIQHLGNNYTVVSASFTVNVLTASRFEAVYTMVLSGGATISEGVIKVNI
jgi:hypothetical protein